MSSVPPNLPQARVQPSLCDASARYSVVYGGAVGNAYSIHVGPLSECKMMCANGTWLGCSGFSRRPVQPSFGLGGVAENEMPSECWWHTDAQSFIPRDFNSNENLFVLQQECPPSSCTTDSIDQHTSLCAPTLGRAAYQEVKAATVTDSFGTAILTLTECFDACIDGTWPGCIGFGRDRSVSDDEQGKCWWVVSEQYYYYYRIESCPPGDSFCNPSSAIAGLLGPELSGRV